MAEPITLIDLQSIGTEQLSGVGPKKHKALAEMGIDNMLDLLTHYPRRYIDRSQQRSIRELQHGESAMVVATVRSISSRRVRGNRVMVTGSISDGSGVIKITFFNQSWRERQLPSGTEAIFFGKVEDFRGAKQFTNPIVDMLGTATGKIVAVYPQSEKSGLSSSDFSEFCAQVIRRCSARTIAETVPAFVLEQFNLMSRWDAFRMIHEPTEMAATMVARQRLVFDELLRIQLALVQRKRDFENDSVGIAHPPADALIERYLARLPYALTNAQRRTIQEILADMQRGVPMHRLLQGDVGAGKTTVAVTTMLNAVAGRYQAALMAPTEVLAEQHFAGLVRDLDGFTVEDSDASLFAQRELRVALLSQRVPAAQRRRVTADLAAGTIDIVVGTQALIQQGVEFAKLGAVVIDEQHRFGVEQRAALRAVNADLTQPDVLVMTATPIPRTAAMTVYGDLDVSVLDELPPGRTPIVTKWVKTDEEMEHMWNHIRSVIAHGRQAFVVCPLITESDKLEVASAESVFEELSHGQLAAERVGLLHGKMTGQLKDETMTRFRRNELDVLVATTVIEVGVDVPNATVMVILDADRFGMAQLHQLRGRVGRGAHESECFLLASEPTPDGEQRLNAMVQSTDGFHLAEVDLELRGEGTIMGDRQKGRSDLKLASLRRDGIWVERARLVAMELVGDGTGMKRYPALWDEVALFLDETDEEYLFKG